MKVGSVFKLFVATSALLLLGTGCGSFYASPTFSPLMLLLDAKPTLLPPPVPGQTETNLIMAKVDPSLCDSHLR